MRRQFFSGNTLEQAVMAAARHFGIEPDRVAYSVREKKHGFLKVRRRFVIEVDSTSPERPAQAPAPASSKPAPPATRPPRRRDPQKGSAAGNGAKVETADGGGEAAAAAPFDEGSRLSEPASVERAVREILRFVRVRAEVSVERRDDLFEVEISNVDRHELVDKEGRVLQAMEHLVPRLVRSWIGQGVPVKIDCDGFRAEREEELRDLAMDAADDVRNKGVSRRLDPMSPADRRIVHLALADDEDVSTESEGDGYYKRVRIFPDGTDDQACAGDEYEDDDLEDDDEYEDDDLEDDDEYEDDDLEDDELEDDDEYDDDEYEDDDFEDDDEYEDDDLEEGGSAVRN